jgi:hypothetical protein
MRQGNTRFRAWFVLSMTMTRFGGRLAWCMCSARPSSMDAACNKHQAYNFQQQQTHHRKHTSNRLRLLVFSIRAAARLALEPRLAQHD